MKNTISGEKIVKNMTLGKFCEIIGISLPHGFDLNEPVLGVYGASDYCREHTIAMLIHRNGWHCKRCLEKGTSVIFVPEALKNTEFVNEHKVIGVADVTACIIKYENFIRELFDVKIVTVTGSVGKTTTSDMLKCVLGDAFKMHSNPSISNSQAAILRIIQGLHDDDEIYLQEVGGSQPGYVTASAKGLRPDIAVITNVGEAHLDLYGSLENILKDKASLVEELREGGVAFFDADNEYLKHYQTEKKVIFHAIHDKNADFYAENITILSAERQKFDIICKATGTRYPAEICILGEHNVRNALCAFAVGTHLGIPADKIIASLEKYRSQGTRQNLCNIGGHNLFLDMFNAAPHTLIGSVEVLESLELKSNGRRIVIFGDIAHLGEKSMEIHKGLGEKLAQHNIDILYCFGE